MGSKKPKRREAMKPKPPAKKPKEETSPKNVLKCPFGETTEQFLFHPGGCMCTKVDTPGKTRMEITEDDLKDDIDLFTKWRQVSDKVHPIAAAAAAATLIC
jgi:hypothetical protein